MIAAHERYATLLASVAGTLPEALPVRMDCSNHYTDHLAGYLAISESVGAGGSVKRLSARVMVGIQCHAMNIGAVITCLFWFI